MSAEKWAGENNLKFPPIDAEMQYEKFGMKEFYVFRDPNDPSCPVVVHFVLVNIKFKEEIKPGTHPFSPLGSLRIDDNEGNDRASNQ